MALQGGDLVEAGCLCAEKELAASFSSPMGGENDVCRICASCMAHYCYIPIDPIQGNERLYAAAGLKLHCEYWLLASGDMNMQCYADMQRIFCCNSQVAPGYEQDYWLNDASRDQTWDIIWLINVKGSRIFTQLQEVRPYMQKVSSYRGCLARLHSTEAVLWSFIDQNCFIS
ncbi:uncharacterized protein LOC132062478 [Lycium ferocissimum]|uniref:uncharacterized protein LOC132062478 n=1 Tax=Lycium ferocissimum TaxID=112874 RepID=UPI002815CD83|nr:uncharacterized protein LOC132062478 [Lycium ferocissimum]